jgi:hypothetical protein
MEEGARYRITLSSEAILVRFLATKLLQRKRTSIQDSPHVYIGHTQIWLDEGIFRSCMVRCPRSLADSSNGINVVDASEFGDRGFKPFHLLIPVCHVYGIDPCNLAVLVELVCECLEAFSVLVGDEDLDATMLLVLGFEDPARK